MTRPVVVQRYDAFRGLLGYSPCSGGVIGANIMLSGGDCGAGSLNTGGTD